MGLDSYKLRMILDLHAIFKFQCFFEYTSSFLDRLYACQALFRLLNQARSVRLARHFSGSSYARKWISRMHAAFPLCENTGFALNRPLIL